jgi:hypothetical protein
MKFYINPIYSIIKNAGNNWMGKLNIRARAYIIWKVEVAALWGREKRIISFIFYPMASTPRMENAIYKRLITIFIR